MNPNETAVIEAIVSLTQKQGYPPSVREIAEDADISSLDTTHRLLDSLKRKGKVTWVPKKARTIRCL